MITREQFEQLEALDTRKTPVLSAYLDLDPVRQARRSYRIVFEDLVREARERLDESRRAALSREAARVQTWLETEQPHGKGLALFACEPLGLWQVHFFQVPVRDYLAFEPRPDVAPLLELFDDYERYAVALVDKRHARLFTVFAGEIEESVAFEDFVPGKHDEGALSQANFQRHHEAHVYRHLKRVAQSLAERLRHRRFDRLILAGPEEATSELKRLLPRPLAQRVAAVIPAEVAANTAEILQKTLEVERNVERAVEQRLLDELLEIAGGGDRAACGVEPTLTALWLGDVQTLVVADGTSFAGSECSNCGKLEPRALVTCPACGESMRAAQNLVHRCMARALEQHGSVEVVHDEAARRLQQAGGGMGALLRYRLPAKQVA
jgi:peptide chain release factor subunit 1